MSLAGLLGPLAGPTLGGWLVEVATWRGSFLLIFQWEYWAY